MTEPRGIRRVRSALVRGSLALHVAGAVALGLAPARFAMIAGTLLANHLVLMGAGLWPRSSLLGPNLRRLPPGQESDGVVLTFDDGPDPLVTPEVLRLLAHRGHRATFFCVGQRTELHPGLAREIADRGHRAENHSYRHPNGFSLLGPRRLAQELDRAQAAILTATGRAPIWFRAPAGLRSPWLDPLLTSRGLELVSWTRRGFDTVDRDPDRILIRLIRQLRAGDVLLLHDRSSGRADTSRPVVLDVLPRLLDELEHRGLRGIPLPDRGTA